MGAGDVSEGVALDDVWDIGRVAPVKQLYPTEKPAPLLKRIISVASNPGDLVLDPFCGCGTTVVVAQELGRKWVGVDVSPTAVKLIKSRVNAGPGGVETIGLPTTAAELRKLGPHEFQNWVVRDGFSGTVGRRGGDKGIDGFTFMLHEPIQVKQSDNVGRNVIDNFHAAVRRAGKKKGYVVAFSFGKGAHEEAAALKHRDDLEIVLVTVDDLLARLSSETPLKPLKKAGSAPETTRLKPLKKTTPAPSGQLPRVKRASK